MNYFFIDYENVKNQGLEGIEELKADDCVVIFYSANANSITLEMHNKINSSKADIVFEKVNVGKKNALDFQLASYIGYVMGRNEGADAAYHLVTKDSEFSVIGKFWQCKYKTFSVIERIADAVSPDETVLKIASLSAPAGEIVSASDLFDAAENEMPKTTPQSVSEAAVSAEETTVQKPAEETLEMRLAAVLSDKTEIPVIVKIIRQYKTKQGINNALMKKFPSQNNQKSSEIYKAIKPLIADKKGN
ncbi:MAG: hypothetical protein IJL89_08935 [Firmicutes bacterium]|nr:hypothetical protein [Bacillota bacterium]